MNKKLILLAIFGITLIFFSCSKAVDIDEEELKRFVIEYDDAISENWSKSDMKFNEKALENFLASDYLLIDGGNLPWNDWYIYDNDIHIINIEKIHKGEFEYNQSPLGKISYRVYYERTPIGKIINNKIIPIENIIDLNTKKNKKECCVVTLKAGHFFVAYYNYSVDFWVKKKHLPALIKRKELVVDK